MIVNSHSIVCGEQKLFVDKFYDFVFIITNKFI